MRKTTLKYSCAAAAIAVATAMPVTGALAQGDQADANEDIIITVGTRRDARSAADTPAPVDVISTQELSNQGDSDIQNILRTSVPSYNVNTYPIADAATIIRPANLRGLAPDSTLVLVNGKRRHRAAVISFLGGGVSDGAQGADISVIPSIGLKQVEILRDGASSQYGSDAIAGVINFVLKDASDGVSFEAEWGQTYRGDGDAYSVSANVGLPLPSGGFINISGEYGETDATDRSIQRTDAAALIAAGNTAVASADVNTVTGDHVQIWGQPNINDDYTVFVNAAIPFSEAFEAYTFGNYTQRQTEGGFFYRNPTNRGAVYAGPQVNPATGNALITDDMGTPMDPSDDTFTDAITAAAVLAPSSSVLVGNLAGIDPAACPAGIPLTSGGGLIPDPTILATVAADANCFSFVETIPGGFTPRFGGDLTDKAVTAGIRGLIGNLSYDLSYSYGRSDVDFFINNTINASLGPNTPRDFMPGGYSQIDNNFNVDFSYAIPNNMFASDLVLSFGAEHRNEQFEIRAGDPNSFAIGPLASPSPAFPGGQGFSSSSNGFGGFTTASAGINGQKNYAIYGEVETELTERFTIQGALRFEDFYDSFGDTLNYKVGGLYRVTDNFRVRSTYSTGFHAPTAGQANVTNITTQFSGTMLVDQGTIPLSSPAGQFIADRLELSTGVRPTLGPEESKNFTAGVAFNLAGVDLTIDYFRISVSDRISISDQQDFLGELLEVAMENAVVIPGGSSTSQVLNLLDGAGVLNAADFQGSEDLTSFGFFSNSFDTRTQGIDVIASNNFELYQGSNTNMALAFNWTDTMVTDRGLTGAAPLSLGRARQLEDTIPNLRGNITFNHTQGPARALIRVNYYGSFFECHLDATSSTPPQFCDLPHDGGAQFPVDLELGYEVVPGLEFIAGAQNAFNSYPTELSAANGAGVAGAVYPPIAPAGFNGGFYYFKVRGDF